MTKYWIQTLRPGTYRAHLKRLGLIKGDEEKIPLTISRKICDSEVNSTIKINGKRIKVTRLLKTRACNHLKLVRLAKKRKKKRKK